MKHPSRYNLLTPGTHNPKTAKAAGVGNYANVILHLAPDNVAGVGSVCPWAGACAKGCLNTAGRGAMSTVQRARIRRTRLLRDDPDTFHALLYDDLFRFATRAFDQGFEPVARLNGTSDLPIWRWPAFEHWRNDITFYDYTKRPYELWPSIDGYHRTYSYDPANGWDSATTALDNGANVAVVFDTPKTQPLPDSWRGYRVIDGRAHDYRFLDPAGVIVGLSALGKARNDYTFTQKAG